AVGVALARRAPLGRARVLAFHHFAPLRDPWGVETWTLGGAPSPGLRPAGKVSLSALHPTLRGRRRTAPSNRVRVLPRDGDRMEAARLAGGIPGESGGRRCRACAAANKPRGPRRTRPRRRPGKGGGSWSDSRSRAPTAEPRHERHAPHRLDRAP